MNKLMICKSVLALFFSIELCPASMHDRVKVKVGDTFVVSLPLITENNKQYGWQWTNKAILNDIISKEKNYSEGGKHFFIFKALKVPALLNLAPGNLNIEFINLRPSQVMTIEAKGQTVYYVTIVNK